MSLREVQGPPGPPWDRPLGGTLERLVVHSDLLEGNPLADPACRPLYVYRPPGVPAGGDGDLCCIYVIQGFTGQLDAWLGRTAFEPTFIERLDTMFAAGECPPAVVVLVDAWTSRGGSQFLNSTSLGRYQDYLCDEVVPFVDARYPVRPEAAARGLTGKSSGGYGAMVVPMVRPDVFGALASHAGDALFECCYQPDFPAVVRALRDEFEGSFDVFHQRLAESPRFDFARFGKPLETYGYACAYSPDAEHPGEALLPFDLDTGRMVDAVWERWLALDPVRMAPAHGEALAGLRRIYLDAGRSDEWFLDLGAQAFAGELTKLGIPHTLELFEGRHGGLSYRYPAAIRELVLALDKP
jgi:S-formylglutathione hydrolase FrmB